MERYQTTKKLLDEIYGKLIHKKSFNDEVLKNNNNDKYVKQIADTTDEEGLTFAYETKYRFGQHYNALFIAGTKDPPVDHIDDLRLPFDDTLNETKRGRDADASYRSHHEIDTVIGHSLGGSVPLALEKHTKKVLTLME